MRYGFDELTAHARTMAEEYYEIRVRESAEHDGVHWFKHEDLANRADEIRETFELLVDLFRAEAERFRTGEY